MLFYFANNKFQNLKELDKKFEFKMKLQLIMKVPNFVHTPNNILYFYKFYKYFNLTHM